MRLVLMLLTAACAGGLLGVSMSCWLPTPWNAGMTIIGGVLLGMGIGWLFSY
jgi:hypothetical protein